MNLKLEVASDTKVVDAKDYLLALAESNGGELTPEIVVTAARNPKSPIHGEFEWDKDKAWEEYLLVQARQLLRRYKITVVVQDTKPVTIRLFSNVANEEGESVYVATVPAMEVPDYRAQIVEQAKREARSFAERYRAFEACAKLVSALDEFVGQ